MMLGLLGVLRQVGFSQGPGSHASRLLQLMAQPCVLANPASSFPAADGQQARGMATKKAGGTARQRPDTLSRNLGTKYLHNELVFPGMIIVRQRGTKCGRFGSLSPKSVQQCHCLLLTLTSC